MPDAEWRAAYQDAYNIGDIDGIGNFYAEDAIDMPPDGERLVGRAAIEASVAQQKKDGWGKLVLNPLEDKQIGDFSFESGSYTIQRVRNGAPVQESGHYFFLFTTGPDGNPLILRVIAT